MSTPTPNVNDVKIEHRTAAEELNQASAHVTDAIALAVQRMKAAGDPDKADIAKMRTLRKDLIKVFEDVADLAPAEKEKKPKHAPEA